MRMESAPEAIAVSFGCALFFGFIAESITKMSPAVITLSAVAVFIYAIHTFYFKGRSRE